MFVSRCDVKCTCMYTLVSIINNTIQYNTICFSDTFFYI